jgi:hypothetical protein
LISNIGPHYACTLREWRRRFENNFQLWRAFCAATRAGAAKSLLSSPVDGYVRQVDAVLLNWGFFFFFYLFIYSSSTQMFTLFFRLALPSKNAGRPGGIVHSDN